MGIPLAQDDGAARWESPNDRTTPTTEDKYEYEYEHEHEHEYDPTPYTLHPTPHTLTP